MTGPGDKAMFTQAKVRRLIMRQSLLVIALTALVPFYAPAQNALDATTPPGQSAGAPAGTYSLS